MRIQSGSPVRFHLKKLILLRRGQTQRKVLPRSFPDLQRLHRPALLFGKRDHIVLPDAVRLIALHRHKIPSAAVLVRTCPGTGNQTAVQIQRTRQTVRSVFPRVVGKSDPAGLLLKRLFDSPAPHAVEFPELRGRISEELLCSRGKNHTAGSQRRQQTILHCTSPLMETENSALARFHFIFPVFRSRTA